MRKYIGGFLELELFDKLDSNYHAGAIALSCGRAGISHIINRTNMIAVWLPYYTCNALLEPFERLGIPYRFYEINKHLELINQPVLCAGEYIIYINYFGLKTSYVRQLQEYYSDRLLVDDTQNYFSHGYINSWSFNSARKSFGVPDGSYTYGPAAQIGDTIGYPENTNYNVQHLVDRLRGAQDLAYEEFIKYEQTLSSEPLKMSKLSSSLLSQINYTVVAAKRRNNYQLYHNALGKFNNTLLLPLDLVALSPDTVPFCYPLVLDCSVSFDRRILFEQDIFIAMLWPDVLKRRPDGYTWERQLAQCLLPLPVDHRYGPTEINHVVTAVLRLLNN
jgi:hypothetical protein